MNISIQGGRCVLVRVGMANLLMARLEACIAADTTPPPWTVEMMMSGRPLGQSQKAFRSSCIRTRGFESRDGRERKEVLL